MSGKPGVPPVVVKIGGSLFGSPDLVRCIDAIEASGHAVAIVAGGGPFADAVRVAQRDASISDGDAHCMALLAMAQFAHVVAAAGRRLDIAHSVEMARDVLARGRVPVWAPLDLAVNRGQVEESWDMTSDSLAVWFANQLRARRLVLVKSAPHDSSPACAGDRAASGLTDAHFPAQLAALHVRAYWIGDRDARRLAAFLSGDEAAATTIAAQEGG